MIATLITALYLLGVISSANALTFLYVTGVILIIAEFTALSTFGILAFNGLLSLAVGYTLDTGSFFGLGIDWRFFFGIAFAEVLLLIGCVLVHLRIRKEKITTGTESMLGERAEVIEWSKDEGRVRIHGEEWKAVNINSEKIKTGDMVTIGAIDNLTLTVTKGDA